MFVKNIAACGYNAVIMALFARGVNIHLCFFWGGSKNPPKWRVLSVVLGITETGLVVIFLDAGLLRFEGLRHGFSPI